MTHILALSGKKQSGKNTGFNFLLGLELLKLSVVREKIEITPSGELFISDIFGDKEYSGIFDICRNNEAMNEFKNEYIYPFIRNYSFADLLKQGVCVDLLGLSHEQCYGTDEQKNTFTELRWEDMPGVVGVWMEDKDGNSMDDYKVVYSKSGKMTAREVMQYVGTNIFRRMRGNVWAEGTIKKIKKDGGNFAIITDCRFPNEVEAVQAAGGKVVRFTRSPFTEDQHDSETALDKDKYDWDNFDAVIDNENADISATNGMLYEQLAEWGFVDHIDVSKLNTLV